MRLGEIVGVDLAGLFSQAVIPPSGEACATVFEVDCDRAAAQLANLEAALDADELAQLHKLKQPLQRQRAAVMRGSLRWVLSAYLRVPPDRVPLIRTPDGRPRLRLATGERCLTVSSAFCRDIGTFVVATDTEIGIDLEYMDPQRFPIALARHILHPREVALFEALPATARTAWLATAWVCKEAMLKALGVGLRMDPRRMEVMSSDHAATPLGGAFRPGGLAPWSGCLCRRGAVLTAVAFADPATSLRRVRLGFPPAR